MANTESPSLKKIIKDLRSLKMKSKRAASYIALLLAYLALTTGIVGVALMGVSFFSTLFTGLPIMPVIFYWLFELGFPIGASFLALSFSLSNPSNILQNLVIIIRDEAKKAEPHLLIKALIIYEEDYKYRSSSSPCIALNVKEIIAERALTDALKSKYSSYSSDELAFIAEHVSESKKPLAKDLHKISRITEKIKVLQSRVKEYKELEKKPPGFWRYIKLLYWSRSLKKRTKASINELNIPEKMDQNLKTFSEKLKQDLSALKKKGNGNLAEKKKALNASPPRLNSSSSALKELGHKQKEKQPQKKFKRRNISSLTFKPISQNKSKEEEKGRKRSLTR